MRFALYLPPAARHGPVPVLYYLAGLTCTEETATIKAGAQAHASRLGLALAMPDTSPRGAAIEGEDDDWDFGTGAGFYLNATQAPWSAHYRMDAWVTGELRALVASRFPVRDDATGVFGHSMGGHGALTIALKNPDAYRTVSAFAPICAPSQCPWGEKAFSGYLGRRSGGLGRARRRRPRPLRCEVRTDPRRPGRGRPVPGGAASSPPARSGVPGDRPAARAPPPSGLRPQLLLHPDVHRLPPGAPRARPGRLNHSARGDALQVSFRPLSFGADDPGRSSFAAGTCPVVLIQRAERDPCPIGGARTPT